MCDKTTKELAVRLCCLAEPIPGPKRHQEKKSAVSPDLTLSPPNGVNGVQCRLNYTTLLLCMDLWGQNHSVFLQLLVQGCLGESESTAAC